MIRHRIEYTGTGFPVLLLEFPAYKDGATYFPDVGPQGLHRAIAIALLRRGGFLTGRELRFLRTHLDDSRSEFARRLGITRRTLINWEDSGVEPLPAAAIKHVSLRVIVANRLAPDLRLPDEALRPPDRASTEPLQLDFNLLHDTLVVLDPPQAKPVDPLDAFQRGSKLKRAAA